MKRSQGHVVIATLGYVVAATFSLAVTGALPAKVYGQNASKSDQWIHVRVVSKDDGGETVRVNLPIEMAVKVLPAIQNDHLHDGKVRVCNTDVRDVDLRVMLDAVRSARDGEYVTVQGHEEDVRVAKNGGYLYIHVTDKKSHVSDASEDSDGKKKHDKGGSAKESKVEIKVPMKVVDALLSSGKDELDLVAALHALSANDNMDLLSVKDGEETVRVWIDSKNISE
jgi:hypothetical protein